MCFVWLLEFLQKPIWYKIISTYDPSRTSYDCYPGSVTCKMNLITPDGIHYTIEDYSNRSYLKINGVQQNDYGTYICSAPAISKSNLTITVYQTIDLRVGVPQRTIIGSK